MELQVSADEVYLALMAMSKFKPITCELRLIVTEFIIHQLMPKNDKKGICRIFNALNLTCDGILSP